jgi:hypothetical protein
MTTVRAALACALLAAVAGIGSRSVLSAAPVYGAAPSSQSETPSFVQAGKRYAFTWSGGGPAQTYTVKSVRNDGWVLVDVAEETVNPALLVPGEYPTRWLNVALAISIQEMRPVIQ